MEAYPRSPPATFQDLRLRPLEGGAAHIVPRRPCRPGPAPRVPLSIKPNRQSLPTTVAVERVFVPALKAQSSNSVEVRPGDVTEIGFQIAVAIVPVVTT